MSTPPIINTQKSHLLRAVLSPAPAMIPPDPNRPHTTDVLPAQKQIHTRSMRECEDWAQAMFTRLSAEEKKTARVDVFRVVEEKIAEFRPKSEEPVLDSVK